MYYNETLKCNIFISDLTPLTEYEFHVLAVNNIGRGPPSEPSYATTLDTSKYQTYWQYSKYCHVALFHWFPS